MRGVFVTGTDTGVGKTVVAAALAAVSEGAVAFKPVVTGLDEPRDDAWPPDDELLGRAGAAPALIPYRFGPAVSPHLAAELAGVEIEFDRLVAAPAAAGLVVAEGVGGLLVPLTPSHTVRDLAVELGLPVIVAARPGLGTINHTLLTLEAARAAGLTVAAVVMTPWPEAPSTMERSNRATIGGVGQVRVAGLPPLRDGSLAELRRGGAALREQGVTVT